MNFFKLIKFFFSRSFYSKINSFFHQISWLNEFFLLLFFHFFFVLLFCSRFSHYIGSRLSELHGGSRSFHRMESSLLHSWSIDWVSEIFINGASINCVNIENMVDFNSPKKSSKNLDQLNPSDARQACNQNFQVINFEHPNESRDIAQFSDTLRPYQIVASCCVCSVC